MSDYPVPPPGDSDPRFSYGLLIDVAKVLAAHGLPAVRSGTDMVQLQQALFGFIYGTKEDEQ